MTIDGGRNGSGIGLHTVIAGKWWNCDSFSCRTGTKLGWYRRLELKVGISIEALPAAVQEEKRVGPSSKILEESLQCRFLWKRLFIVTECQ